MADGMFNIARGRARYWYDQVDGNLVQATGVAGPPNTVLYNGDATAQIMVMAINRGGVTDDAMKDFKSVSLLLASAADEVQNTGYARKVLDDTSLAAAAENDTTNTLPLDIPDLTWTGVLNSGGAVLVWTDLVVCWKPTSASADSAIIPISFHVFALTADGSDVTAAIPALGFYGSS